MAKLAPLRALRIKGTAQWQTILVYGQKSCGCILVWQFVTFYYHLWALLRAQNRILRKSGIYSSVPCTEQNRIVDSTLEPFFLPGVRKNANWYLLEYLLETPRNITLFYFFLHPAKQKLFESTVETPFCQTPLRTLRTNSTLVGWSKSPVTTTTRLKTLN